MKGQIVKCYRFLSELHEQLNNDQKALEYFKLYSQNKDSVFNETKSAQIAEMQTKYDTEKKEKDIILLKKENEIQQLQLSKKNSLILTLSIGILIFITISVVVFMLYQRRNEVYKRLVEKNLDLIYCENPGLLPQKDKKLNLIADHDKELTDLAFKFDDYLKNEKPFLFSEIHYDDVCKKLNSNRTYLSKAINISYNKSFTEVINYFRIVEASLYLSNPKYNHISIEGIGQMTGFNYKATFHSNFKKQVGITPSFFRKNSQGKL